MEIEKLNISNFYKNDFNPKSSHLSKEDQTKALVDTLVLECLLFGLDNGICTLVNAKETKAIDLTKPTSKFQNQNPMPGENKFLSLDLKMKKEDFEGVKKGNIPYDMDDRWFIDCQDGHIYFHRSWTGNMIFDCSFKENGDEVELTGVRVNQDPKQYSETSDESNIESLKDLFKGYFGVSF